MIQGADLITFMFVMNELFVNKTKSMALIQSLVSNMKKGAYLLIVDSAGSFSHLKVGGQTYMIYFLLDAIKTLEKVIAEDSKWYRCVYMNFSYMSYMFCLSDFILILDTLNTFNTHWMFRTCDIF